MNRLPFSLLLFPAIAAASLSVDGLRCEFLKNPVGVENPSPRFSWIARESDTSRRGQDITGFEIRVAKTADGLDSESGCLWQSKGKGRDLAVCYQGPALDSGRAYYWQVRASDADGILSPWSSPARFVLALQKRDEWSGAQWIGEPGMLPSALNAFQLTAKVSNIQDAFGIFFHASDTSNACLWQFNRGVSGKLCLRPHIFQNGNPQFLPQTEIESRFPELCDWSKPHTVELDVKGETVRTFWDGKLVDERKQKPLEHGLFGFRTTASEGVDVHQLTVTDATGKTVIDERFQKRESCVFRGAEIKNGVLILRGKSVLNRSPLPKNCPRFRKTFALQAKPIREAYASVIGMGFYELYLNGERIGDRREAAPYSNFGSFLNFDTLEVTGRLRSGTRNTVGLWLAPGYSDDFSQWACKWEQPKRALLRLFVTFADGTTQTVVTDASWETTQHSPISYASIYGGETYDASAEDPTWCRPEGSREGWAPVQIMPPYRGELRASLAEPTRIAERDKPVRITEPSPGVFIADFGQNRSAVVRIRAKGKRGTKIVMRHSELLGKDGRLDPWTNRGAKATDTFLLAGTGDWEVYEPHFTTHGFRYAEITGYPGKLTPDDIEQCAIHADLEYIGRFHCSDEGLNKLHNAARWSMLSNFHAYPSDCCMRDERTPCQMDSQAYEDTACRMFWMPRYYLNWIRLIERGRGWPCWNGDSVTLPMRLFRHYGDIRILQEQYSNMVYTTGGALANFPGNLFKDAFGDWCTPNDGTWAGYHGNPEVTDCAILGKMIRDLVSTAAFLRLKVGESRRWQEEYERFKKVFHEKLFHADTHTYGNGSQTTAVLPLAFDLVPEAEKKPVFRQLVKTIRDKDKSRVDTGIFGTRYLADVLCEYGEEDLAVHLMTQPEYPGYGFMFANGATTLWEQWTFRGGMNSHNHAMFSGGAHFLYSCIGGINPGAQGYGSVLIRPVFPKSIQFATASCQTVRGEVACSWRRDGDAIVLRFSIPIGVTADVTLPAKPQEITENGKVFAGTATPIYANGKSAYTVLSGNYELRIRQPY